MANHSESNAYECQEGSYVWVPDKEEAWKKAIIVSSSNNSSELSVKLESTGNIIAISLKDVRVLNTFEEASHAKGLVKLRDLTTLTHLHEPALLEALSARFKAKKIYTNTGPILLAVNPFQLIDGLYTKKLLLHYYTAGIAASQIASNVNLEPHIYKTADQAYRSLLDEDNHNLLSEDLNEESNVNQNQSILVSGESGAGKTESTKHIMSYLATVSNQNSHENKKVIADMVLKSNPILESFGNARTIRNDNSSRFGKYIEMQFDYKGQLVGARIRTYLLEKARINAQALNERNYHIFYQLMKGADSDMKTKYKLRDLDLSLETCALSNKSCCFTRQDGVSDKREFEAMINAMRIMSFTGSEIDNILRIISGILHLSNVDVQAKVVNGNDASYIVENDESRKRVDIILELFNLRCNFQDFEVALTERKRTVGQETYHNVLNVSDSLAAVGAMIKSIYSRLFDWIVKRINQSIEFDPANNLDSSFDSSMEMSFIGILDIFGFEVFDHNSFEQLCINYANETLQQQFNHFVFKLEQRVYEQENINWKAISFPDNEAVLRLIDGRPLGILSLLDEQCLFPNGDDEKLARKYYEKLSNVEQFNVTDKERVNYGFSILHYAGKVSYETKGFCKKNKDQLFQEALDLLQTTDNALLSILYPKHEKTGITATKAKNIQAVTIGTQFKLQLKDLLAVIKSTHPHYVRCLKPNDENVKLKLNRVRLMDQLKYGGVLEAVKVARAGYPVRMPSDDFKRRYHVLVSNQDDSIETLLESKFCLKLIDDYQIGLTKIFLRNHAYELLETKRSILRRKQAIHIQSFVRMRLRRNKFVELKQAALKIQTLIRQLHAIALVQNLRQTKRATEIQCIWRKYIARKSFLSVLFVIDFLQRRYRGYLARVKYMELRYTRSVIIIQRFLHMGKDRRTFLVVKKTVLLLQCKWRVILAKRKFGQLKLEARQVGSLQLKIKALQEKVNNLEVALETEKLNRNQLEVQLETIQEEKEDDEVIHLQRQLQSYQKENISLLDQNEALRNEVASLKVLSISSEEIDQVQETVQHNDTNEALSDIECGEENVKVELDYWSKKMENGARTFPVEKPNVSKQIANDGAEDVELHLSNKLHKLKTENERLIMELNKKEKVVLLNDSENAQDVVKIKQENTELKVALEALAQENKDYKRAHFELQENMQAQIEKACSAENRSIEIEDNLEKAKSKLNDILVEKDRLEQEHEETIEKVNAISVLNEQSSGVKIALARRLEELLAEKKKYKNVILGLKKKLRFVNDTNQDLQREVDRIKKPPKRVLS